MTRFGFLAFWIGVVGIGCGGPGSAGSNTTTGGDRPGQNITNSIGMKLVSIPAGEFQMGAADSIQDARADEQPQHLVRITHSFHMGAYEVTQEEFERVMGSNPSFYAPTGPGRAKVEGMDTARFPVEQVSWNDAVEFCRRLSGLSAEKQAGRIYRLPTEAEWEYACRAGTTTPFHFGTSLASTQANFNGDDPYGDAPEGPFLVRSVKVGSHPANEFGLHDMHGNIIEWCADRYEADYYKTSPEEDPPGPATGTSRVIRGGGWRTEGVNCRSAYRNSDVVDGHFYVLGLRVVMAGSDHPIGAPKVGADRPVASAKTPQASAESAPLVALTADQQWPNWRGPTSDGTWKGPKLAEQWPEGGLPRLWQSPVGPGYSGISIAEGRVYTMDRQLEPKEVERVLCLNADTGEPLWTHTYEVEYGALDYRKGGPRTTPTFVDGWLYTLGAVGHLFCLQADTGEVVWSKELVGGEGAKTPIWGFAAAPIVYGRTVIVHAGDEPDGCLIAYDLETGEERWRSLPDQAGYATPILIQSGGVEQLVSWTPTNVHGVDPGTGKPLWSVPFVVNGGTAIVTPIFQAGVVVVSGYWEGALAIRLGDDPSQAEVIWEDRRRLRALMAQPLYRDGHAYLLDRRQGLTCFEIGTGKKVWDDNNRMTPKGRNPQATMVWLSDEDRVIVLNSDGELILARLNPTGYHEQSRRKIIGLTWAHPAYVGDRVYARDNEELVCVSLTSAIRRDEPSPPK